MNYKIGLDIGIASVGWATVLLDENDEPYKIDHMGVRTFEAAEHPKDGSSLALPRREARGARRRLRRHNHRLLRMKYLFEKSGLMTQEQIEQMYIDPHFELDVYALRVKALDALLNREEFVRLLIHLAQRRGFLSNRKVDAQDKNSDAGVLTKAVSENAALMALKNYRTVGEMLYKDEKFAGHKRNKASNYLNTVSRSAMVDEVTKIFEAQTSLGSTYATQELKDCYLEIYTSQRAFDEGPGGDSKYGGNQVLKMLGKCTFEPQEYRAFKAQYSFEYFNLLQKINAIRISGPSGVHFLTQSQRELVEQMAFKVKKPNYGTLRKTLELEADTFFNISYGNADVVDVEKKTQFSFLSAYHTFKSVFGEDFEQFDLDKKDALGFVFSAYKNDTKIQQQLQSFGFTQPEIDLALTLPSFSKAANISVTACRKMTPFLKQGQVYSQACQSAGYNFKADDKMQGLYLPAHASLAPELGDLNNPVVRRAVSQTIKVVNSIVRMYGCSPSYLAVETARDLAHNKQERNQIEKRQKENALYNEKIVKRIKDEFSVITPHGLDVLKLKLWEQQDGCCPYSQKPIELDRLFEDGYVDVDHIVPYSISFDDSYKNKVLVLSAENRQKGNRLPMQYVADKEAYIIWVNTSVKDRTKRGYLLKEGYTLEEQNSFKERNLNDTKYISRFLHSFFIKYLAFAPTQTSRKKRVMAVNGAVTAYLRRRWGIQKVREDGDLHHAVDAAVIACVTDGMIRRISSYAKYSETKYMVGGEIDRETGEVIDKFPKPYPHFTDEIDMRTQPDPQAYLSLRPLPNYGLKSVAPIFVSRMPRRKTKGAAHAETLRSVAHTPDGYYVSKVPLNKLKLDKNGEIDGYFAPKDDTLLYNALKQRLISFGGNGEKAFEKEFYKPKSDGTPGPVVKRVKIVGKTSLNVPLNGGNAVADNGSMVRIDVFYVAGQGYYFVPIYVADTVKSTLPNRASVAAKPYDQWKEMDDKDFVFSLYPNDLIKVTAKKEMKFSLNLKESTMPKEYVSKEEYLYYKFANISTAAICVETQNSTYVIKGLGVKTVPNIEKWQVDVLGNISKAGFEPRQYFKQK